MKRKLIISFISLAFIVAGCGSSSVKADKNLVCRMVDEYEGHQYEYYIDVNYDSETMFAESATFSQKHTNISKEEQRGRFVVELMSRESVLTELEGISVISKPGESTFSYEETWNYNDVDMEEVLQVDDLQSTWIEDEHYSAQKIKDYYASQGYSCDMDREIPKKK